MNRNETLGNIHDIIRDFTDVSELDVLFDLRAVITTNKFEPIMRLMDLIFQTIERLIDKDYRTSGVRKTEYIKQFVSACKKSRPFMISGIAAFQMAKYYHDSGSLMRAREWYIRAEERGHKRALYALYQLEFEEQHFGTALDHILDVLYGEHDKKFDGAIYYAISKCYHKLKDYPRALEYWEKSSRLYNRCDISHLKKEIMQDAEEPERKKRKLEPVCTEYEYFLNGDVYDLRPVVKDEKS